jgi:hypothetical protein
MTEEEWLVCNDPEAMLRFLSANKSRRKFALFGVACCRRIPRLCQEPLSAAAVEVAERRADRKAKVSEVRLANRKAGPPPGDYSHYSRAALDRYLAEHSVLCNASCNANLVSEYAIEAASHQGVERKMQCALLRELFGNPFRRVRVKKVWSTDTVRRLAEAIYDERDFDSLPILGDALEDAGCSDRALLDHCRGPGAHVRGCWVVDLVLEKS